MFFDDHPEFLETSSTSVSVRRLNLRHKAIIEQHRDILRDARVLDIASHDGRWSYAALDAGAKSVTGIEGRQYLVDNATNTFEKNGVDPSRFTFIVGDAHDVLTAGVGTFDVVMCLGFLYHTLRYGELFAGIRATGARHLILDTRVTLSAKPVITVSSNPVATESMAVEDRFSNQGKTLAGDPSMPALEHMLGVYDYEIVERTDWGQLLAGYKKLARRYRNGARVTLVAARR